MTEETKKRYVAFICSSEPGMQSIYFEVDLGENKGEMGVDNILEITKGAKLGQWGSDISRYEIQIRQILSLEEFTEICDIKRAELEKQQQQDLKKEAKEKEEREEKNGSTRRKRSGIRGI